MPTVFHEPWWLEAATGGRFQQVEVLDGSRTLGRFSFTISQRFGIRKSILPTLTHVLGPAVDEGSGSAKTRLLRRYGITRELISRLPHVHRFRHKLHRGYPEVLSFQGSGFKTGVQFTFELQPRPEIELWDNLRNKTRNVIRRAREEIQLFEMQDVEEFLRFHQQNLTHRGRSFFYNRAECKAICTAALERKAGKIVCARKRGRVVAATFLAWDLTSAYYLMSSRTPDAGNGAISLLIWHGIQFCCENNLIFDFDGVANEGAILLFAGFGGTPAPRYTVTKESYFIQFADLSRRALSIFEESLFDG